jgi:hypothetical protein
VEPGKPLGFLDANIRCGDSLLGVFNLDALKQGIPDAAYKQLSGDEALQKLIRNNHPLIEAPHEKFKVWPTNADRDDFRAVMTCDGRAGLLIALGLAPDTERTERPIPDAYLYFSKVIGEWLAADAAQTDVRIKSLYSAIWDNVRLVVIDLDDKDDAQVIFETLNARGTPLLSADLVKNSLLNEVLAAEGNAEEAYEQYWKQFDTDAKFWRALTGRGHAQRARIETFLQHTLALLTGKLSAVRISIPHTGTMRRRLRPERRSIASGRAMALPELTRLLQRVRQPEESFPPASPLSDRPKSRFRLIPYDSQWPWFCEPSLCARRLDQHHGAAAAPASATALQLVEGLRLDRASVEAARASA